MSNGADAAEASVIAPPMKTVLRPAKRRELAVPELAVPELAVPELAVLVPPPAVGDTFAEPLRPAPLPGAGLLPTVGLSSGAAVLGAEGLLGAEGARERVPSEVGTVASASADPVALDPSAA